MPDEAHDVLVDRATDRVVEITRDRMRRNRRNTIIAVGLVVAFFAGAQTIQTVVIVHQTKTQRQTADALLCNLQIQGAQDLTLIRKAFRHFGARLGRLPGEEPVECDPNPNHDPGVVRIQKARAAALEQIKQAMESARRDP